MRNGQIFRWIAVREVDRAFMGFQHVGRVGYNVIRMSVVMVSKHLTYHPLSTQDFPETEVYPRPWVPPVLLRMVLYPCSGAVIDRG